MQVCACVRVCVQCGWMCEWVCELMCSRVLLLFSHCLAPPRRQRADIRAMVVAAAGCVDSDATTVDAAAGGESVGQQLFQQGKEEMRKSEG